VAALAITSNAMLVPRARVLDSAARDALQIESGSSEFQINDVAGYGESYVRPGRAVSRAADDSFVVAWNARAADGGIFARRYSALGAPLGTEIRLTPNGLYVGNSAVASDADGSFLVVYDDIDVDGAGVFGRSYAADGTAINDDFPVNSWMNGNQRAADVAATGAGTFVVVWSDYGQSASGEVMGQRFDLYADFLGLAFQVNSYTTGVQRLPSVASRGDGSFVVVWESGYSASGAGADGSGAGLSAQRFDANGAKAGTEFVVNTTTAGDQIEPDVAVTSSGDFAVVWQSNGADADGSSAVMARRFSSSGAPAGTEFRVAAYTTNAQDAPSVAFDGDGSFVVMWQSGDTDGIPNGPDGNKTGIFARHFDADGQAASGELQVNAYTTGFQHDVSVAGDGDGGFVVVWAGRSAADTDGLVGRMIGAAIPTTTMPAATTTTTVAQPSSTLSGSTSTTTPIVTTTTLAPPTTAVAPTTTIATPTTSVVTPTTTVGAPPTTTPAPTTTTVTPTTTTPILTTTTVPLVLGACGDAVTAGSKHPGQIHPGDITTSDALRVLRTAVGLDACQMCVCDVDDSGAITASDALTVLKVALGSVNRLVCPACPV
jgi:hypothetical protein